MVASCISTQRPWRVATSLISVKVFTNLVINSILLVTLMRNYCRLAVGSILMVLSLSTLVIGAEDSTPSAYVVPEPAKALFWEDFQSSGWTSRWVVTEDPDYQGTWSVGKGTLDWGVEHETGLLVGNPAKKHGISAVFKKEIDMTDVDLVVQYEVRFHNTLQCGGAYLKLVRKDGDSFTPENFNADTDYVIMFGPDKCGDNQKVHFIFKHKNPITGVYEEKHLQNAPSVKLDQFTHLYTLIIRKDNRFEIQIDQVKIIEGNLLTDFEPPVNPPKTIDDPNDKKPSDWVDEPKIKDPDATKPDDWDENLPEFIPDLDAKKPDGWLDDGEEYIPDPEAVKPEDWDDELDGDWESPMIPNPVCQEVGCGIWEAPLIKNPDYKGKWEAPLIDNPEYKGEWKPRQIDNPDFFIDEHPHNMDPIVAVGFELWTMQDQIMFDNIYIGHDVKEAVSHSSKTWLEKSKIEKTLKIKLDRDLEKAAKVPREGKWGYLLDVLDDARDFIQDNPVSVFSALCVGLVGFFLFSVLGSREKQASTDSSETLEQNDETSDNVSRDSSDSSQIMDNALLKESESVKDNAKLE